MSEYQGIRHDVRYLGIQTGLVAVYGDGNRHNLEWASSKELLFGLQVCNMHQKYSSCCIFDDEPAGGYMTHTCHYMPECGFELP
jgi:hypothetical protein